MAPLVLHVNDQTHTLDVDPDTPLLYVLSTAIRSPTMRPCSRKPQAGLDTISFS